MPLRKRCQNICGRRQARKISTQEVAKSTPFKAHIAQLPRSLTVEASSPKSRIHMATKSLIEPRVCLSSLSIVFLFYQHHNDDAFLRIFCELSPAKSEVDDGTATMRESIA